MADGNNGLTLKILGGSIILVYWLFVSFEIFFNDKLAIIAGVEVVIVHVIGFLLILLGWVREVDRNSDMDIEIAKIRDKVYDNMQKIDIMEADLRQQKSQ